MLARDNPFSTNKVERILSFDPSLNGTSWEQIETRWAELKQRASLIAPHGAGKTTFIDAFVLRLEAQSTPIYRLFLNAERPRITPEQWLEISRSAGKIVILDGEEQLSFLQRRRFFHLTSKAAGVLTSRHAKGKLPPLLSFTPTLTTLEICVKKLAPEHYDTLSPHFPDWWNQHHGNIREILLRCYDLLAKSRPETQ